MERDIFASRNLLFIENRLKLFYHIQQNYK